MTKMNENEIIDGLRQVKEVFDKYGIEFWLDAGTLLGAVRDGKLIEWDKDIDLSAWYNDKNKIFSACRELYKKGFIVDYRVFSIDEFELTHISINYSKKRYFPIDIRLFALDGKYIVKKNLVYTGYENKMRRIFRRFVKYFLYLSSKPAWIGSNPPFIPYSIHVSMAKFLYVIPSKLILRFDKLLNIYLKRLGYSWEELKLPAKYFKNFLTINFYGMKLKVPSRTEEFLEFRYGKDWRTPNKNWVRKMPLGNKNKKIELLDEYYIKSNPHSFYSIIPVGDIITMDKNEIVMYKVPYTTEYHYYPVYIAEYALGNFERYKKTKDEKYKEIFFRQTDWLVSNMSDNGVWEHNYTLPYYNFKIPWVHGMAQGLAISVLLRAYKLTQKHVYLKTAKKAFCAFELDLKDGGVKFVDEKGNVWLEEYGISPPAHILNGFIFALFGVHDFYLVTKDKRAFRLWEEGLKTLETYLPMYDLGYWSLYNLIHQHPAPIMYHKIHISQLNALYLLTGREIFLHYADKWKKCLNSRIMRVRSALGRGRIHIKTHGIKGCIRTYLMVRRWRGVAKGGRGCE